MGEKERGGKGEDRANVGVLVVAPAAEHIDSSLRCFSAGPDRGGGARGARDGGTSSEGSLCQPAWRWSNTEPSELLHSYCSNHKGPAEGAAALELADLALGSVGEKKEERILEGEQG